MTELFDRLLEWRNAAAKAEIASGKSSFMGKPDEWYDDPHWFCESGHVSGRYLKSEEKGALCLGCQKPVFIGPNIGEPDFAPILNRLSRSSQHP